MNLSSDAKKLLLLLKEGKKLTGMVAPSFPVDFKKKPLIGALKKLGFNKVCDHTVAIAEVNRAYESLFEEKKDGVVIAANCPATVMLLKNRYPSLVKFLPPIPSPMGMNAKLCSGWWPKNLNIFIGPCLAKKQEAKEYPEVTLALTYREIKEIFNHKGISLKDFEAQDFDFDGPEKEGVRIFPTSGGMKATLDINHLGCRKIIVGDEMSNLIQLFDELLKKSKQECVFYDVLACQGGCLGGPGVVSQKGPDERKRKLLSYLTEEGEKPLCSEVDVA